MPTVLSRRPGGGGGTGAGPAGPTGATGPTGAGGGGGLPTSWTESGDPADVLANGGSLNVGSGFLAAVDDVDSGQLTAGVLTLANSDDNSSAILADDGTITLSMGGNSQFSVDDAGVLESRPGGTNVVLKTDENEIGFFGVPTVVQQILDPATCTPEDIANALITLGLAVAP